jgi:MFS family permease
MPATLSIIGNVFPAEERARAIGLWAGLAGTAAAVGPVAGGLLLEHFWWGSVLLVNAPLVLVALLGTALVVPTSRDVAVPPIDIEGSLLWAGALAAALYAIIEGPVAGWVSPRVLVGFAASSVLLVGFHRRERAAPAPLLSAHTARSPSLQGGVIAVAATFFAVFGGQFVLTQWYQGPAGLGPLRAGLCFVPQAVGGFVGSLSAPRLASRVGHVTTSIGALMLVTVGLVATAVTLGTGSVAWTAGCFGLVGLGCGGVASAVELIMSSVPAEQAGTASGINETVVEGGGALGVAVLGSVLALGYGPSAALPVAAMVGAGAVVALSCVTRRLPFGT